MLKKYGINYYCAHLHEETHLLSLKIILFSPDESHSSNRFILSSVLLHSWLMDPHEWINKFLLTWKPKNLRFSQRCFWRSKYFAMCCCVLSWEVPHILKYHSAYIFRVKLSKNRASPWRWMHYDPSGWELLTRQQSITSQKNESSALHCITIWWNDKTT